MANNVSTSFLSVDLIFQLGKVFMIPRIFSKILVSTLISFIGLATVAETAFAEPSYSEREFEDVLKYNAARIPEFQAFWRWQESEGRQDIGWTGSSSRGFIRWNMDQLKKYTPEQVKQLPLPPLGEFLPRGGNDIEFVSAPENKEKIISLLPKEYEIDVVNDKVFAELIQKGGPKISNITIHPKVITDPWKGLNDYRSGTLGFISVDEKIFRQLPIIINGDYSKTEMAMRYIRLTYDIPDLKPTPEALAAIRDIHNYETNWNWNLKRRDHGVMITEKMLKTFKGNLDQMLKSLVDYKLLGILAAGGIPIPVENKSLSSYILDGSISILDYTVEQLSQAEEIVGYRTAESHREFLNLVKSKVRTGDDFIALTKVYKHTYFDSAKSNMTWILENSQLLKSLKPSKKQLVKITDDANLTLAAQDKLAREIDMKLPFTRRVSLAFKNGVEMAPSLVEKLYSIWKKRNHEEYREEQEEKAPVMVASKSSCAVFYGASK